MKELIVIPTFDKNGILNGIKLVDRIYLTDEVTIGDETIEITGRGISELQRLPQIVCDVTDTEGFAGEEVPKPSLPGTRSRIARAKDIS